MSIELLGKARTDKELAKTRAEVLTLRQQIKHWQDLCDYLRGQLKKWVDLMSPQAKKGTKGEELILDSRRFLEPVAVEDTDSGRGDVYWNNNPTPVVFLSGFELDPSDGQSVPTKQTVVAPGQGLNLSLLGLSRKRDPRIMG